MDKQPKFDYSDVKFKNNGKLKLVIVVGTRPEIIRLSAVINKCRRYFDVILAHTGQNYDYNLNGVFFKDLKLALWIILIFLFRDRKSTRLNSSHIL